MQLTANRAKALAPHSCLDAACTVSVCKVPGADNEGALPVDSLLQKVPCNSSVARERYSSNGTDIIQSYCWVALCNWENVPPLLCDLLIRLVNLSKEGNTEM